MTPTLRSKTDADRALPLVRAIVREVRERTATIEALEAQAVAGVSTDELQSGLSRERRELRACERELSRLGYGIDADDPHRIVGQGSTIRLDDTQFFRPVSFKT
jgi:hypothetical protein